MYPPRGQALGHLLGRVTEVVQRLADASTTTLALLWPLHRPKYPCSPAGGELEFHDLLVLARAVLRDPRQGSSEGSRRRTR